MPDPEHSFPDLDDAAYQRALAVLLDVGTALALELKSPADQAAGQTASQTVVQRANAFPNLALAVRRTIILSRHIAEHPHTATASDARRAGARRKIIRDVEDIIADEADPAKADALRVELLERLDQPEFDAELAARSPADLVWDLCRDLGLAYKSYVPAALRRTPDDIAVLCAQAAAPAGSGLPQWLAAAAPQAARNDAAAAIRLKER